MSRHSNKLVVSTTFASAVALWTVAATAQPSPGLQQAQPVPMPQLSSPAVETAPLASAPSASPVTCDLFERPLCPAQSLLRTRIRMFRH